MPRRLRLLHARRIGASMIGRDHELAVVDTWLHEKARLGGVLVVEGEAGIGKTTVWNAGVEVGRREGFRVLVTRPVEAEAEAGSSFSGLIDLMNGVVEEAAPGLPPPQRHALEVALLRENAVGTPPDASAVGVATVSALRAVALDTPVLIAVDDLQWLDPATARILGFVVRRAAGEPLAVLTSVRGTRDGDLPPALDRAVDVPRLRRIHLGPFSPAGIHHLLRDRLALEPPRPLLVRLHEASRGNPFLALELGAALQRFGRTPAAAEPLPVSDDLRELLRQRFAGLSPQAYELLLLVAAMPPRSADVLEAALGDDELARAPLHEALQAGILVVDGERIRFAHPLLASTRYADATPGERRRAHAGLAQSADDPEQRARHLALAAEGPDDGVAGALDEAAGRAASRGAPDVAAELVELALRLTPPDATEDVGRRTLLAGMRHAEAGNAVGAADLLERAARAAPGQVRAEALLRLGWVRFRDAGPVVARPIFREALTEAEGGPPAVLAAVHRALAWMEIVSGGASRLAMEHARSEVAAAESTGDATLLADALADLGIASFVRGEDPDATILARAEALDTGPPGTFGGTFLHGVAHMWAGRVDDARPRFERVLALAREAGGESGAAQLQHWLAELEWRAGDWAASLSYALDCAELAEQTGQRLFRSLALAWIAFVEGARGRVLRARAAGQEGLRLAEESGHLSPVILNRHALGLLALSLGDAAEADRLVAPLVEPLRAAEIVEPLIYPFLPDEMEALIALGEREPAAELLQAFEEHARSTDRRTALLAAARCHALLAAARGDVGEALVRAEEAVELAGSAASLEAARALLTLGMIRRRARRRRDAADALDRAVSAFEAIGATIWAERARDERSRVGLRRARGLELTDAERSVAELVARGHTSREVAGMLFMSVRTVDAHLSRIYRKLGVRSRTELARRLPSEGTAEAGKEKI